MLGNIGFAVPAQKEAVYRNVQVYQSGSYITRSCIFGENIGATYAIFDGMPNVSIEDGQIAVTGGADDNLFYADPSYGSEPMLRKAFETEEGKTIESARVYATAQGILRHM